MKTLYVEGKSVLHRLPARVKLVGLAAASVAMFLSTSLPLLTLCLLAAIAIYASLGIGMREALIRLRPIALTIAAVALFTVLVASLQEAALVLVRLTSLMLLAASVTATTPISDFIDEITLAARPLERTGLVRAADIGLAIGLVIRFVPEVLVRYHAIREAHAARGLKSRPLTLAVPLIILTLKNADDIAAAIDARGIRTQK